MLLFHDTKDNSVDVAPIRIFTSEANEKGNDVNLIELQGALYMILRIPCFSRQTKEVREAFLKQLNW